MTSALFGMTERNFTIRNRFISIEHIPGLNNDLITVKAVREPDQEISVFLTPSEARELGTWIIKLSAQASNPSESTP